MLHLSRKQGIGVELLQSEHKLVFGIDHILHETACEREPVRPSRHVETLGDGALTQPPHVIITLVKKPIQALLLNEPNQQQTGRHREIGFDLECIYIKE